MVSGTSRGDRAEGSPPRAALAALLAFALLYGLYYLRVFDPAFPPPVPGDYALNLALARQTADALAYPPHFFYPPPYLAAMLALGALPGAAGFLLWCALQLAAFLAMTALLWRLTAAATAAAGGRRALHLAALGVLGILAAHYGLHWDFRAYNVNLPVLALVGGALALGPRRALLAGLLLALAGALKVYALVLLPWLLWRRDWRWLAATLGWLALLFLLPPLLAFGSAGAWSLTLDWLARMAAAGDPETFAAFPGALASPRALLAAAWGRPIEDPALDLPALAWALAGLVLGLWCAWRLSHALAEGPLGRLLVGSALALLPLVASPVAQPHHAAALLPLTLWLALGLAERRAGAGRTALGLLLLLLALLPYSGALWQGALFRAGVAQSTLALTWLAVGLVARPRAGSQRPQGARHAPPS